MEHYYLVLLTGFLLTTLVSIYAISERGRQMSKNKPQPTKQLERKYEKYEPQSMCHKCDYSGLEKVCAHCREVNK